MSEQVAHVWGFYDDDGRPTFPDGVAVSEETAYEAFCRLRRHVHHFGSDMESLRTTRTLDGWFVGAEFDVPPRGQAARIWHRVMQVQNGWPDFAETEESA